MRDEPLRTLLRVRRLALDEARLTLASCVATETAAAAAIRDIEDEIRRETERASSLDTGDAVVEAFALWLRRVRDQQTRTAAALREAEERTHEARAVLTACRAAVEAVETEIARRDEVRRQEAARVEQRSVDEAASRVQRTDCCPPGRSA